ncbi:MAG: FtsW/RodA/SpoVE family cell cycle protein [Candidatus Cloacimonetes bacterium]|nr:FtsW/RodA/SpoVE family cell cycle protein [Candidatus Cloacimonadota bacterium]
MKIKTQFLEDSLIYIILILILIGLLLIGSIDSFQFKSRNIVFQTFWIFVSILFFFLFSHIHLQRLRAFSFPFLLFGMLLLGVVFVPGIGKTVNYSTRWINLGKFTFQASNLAKVIFIFYMAHFLAKNQDRVERSEPRYFIKNFFPVIFALGIYLGLIYFEPDLSTAGILFLVFVSLLFVAKVKLTTIALIFATVLVVLVILVSVGPGYRRARYVSFVKFLAGKDVQIEQNDDTFFQPRESLIALSNGKLTGRGSEEGKAKLYYLPFAHSDYIFSILGEEYGFAGSVLILILYVLLLVASFTLAQRAHDPFYSFLIAGLGFGIAYNIIVNVAVAISLIPSTGVTLPFISYGGSALLIDSIAVAMIVNASKRDRYERMEEREFQYA